MPPSRTVYVAKRSKRVHPSVLHRYIFTTGYRRLEHAGCRHQWRWQDRSDIQISEHQYVADVPVQWGRDLQASVLHRHLLAARYRRLEHAGCRHQWRWQDRSDIQISEQQYLADVPVQWRRDLQASVLHRHLLAARYRRLEHAGCRHQWRWQDRSDIQISEHQYVADFPVQWGREL